MAENTEVVAGGTDDFDKAFEELAHKAETTAAETPEAKVAREAAEKKATDDAAAAAAAETPEAKAAREAAEKTATDAAAKKAADDAAAAAETPEAKAAREAAEKTAADAAAKKVADDAVAEAAKKVTDDAAAAEAARVAAAAAATETQAAKEAREKLEASIKPYEPTDAEKAAMAQFQKDFPNEYAAMEARFKAVDKDMNARVYAAVQGVLKTVAPRIEAVEATTTSEAAERHFAALKTAHPDYDAVIAKVPEWIKTLPAYAQSGAQAVYDGGTTQEVLALVADYKKAAGITAAPDAAAEAAKAAKAAAEEAARKKAEADAAALTPVGSRRSAAAPTSGTKDKNDYDGAWAELAAAAK